MKVNGLALAAAIVALSGCGIAQAQNNVFKLGITYYDTHSSTNGLTVAPPVLPAGSDAKTDDAATVIFVFERTLTPNIGAELVLGIPPTIKAKAVGPIAGLGEILSAKNVSPTLLVNYYFGQPGDKWRPYVGAGINYTYFADVSSPYPSTDLKMSDSWGLAVQAGVNYQIEKNWGLFASVARVDTSSKVEATGVQVPGVPVPLNLTTSIDFKPWTYSAGAWYRF
jgi:outer membrane protein